MKLEEADFYLDEIFENITDLFSIEADQKGVEIFFEVTPDVPPVLIGDSLRLGQVLNNLVGNAVKFTAEGGIHVKAELAESDGDQCKVKFSVRDTGIGLQEEQIERLFQAFSQADGSITRRYGGSGLGLTISKHFVELMGGEIGVESQLDKGATFSFTAVFGINHAAPAPRNPRNLKGMKTLVVDDQETSRQILQQILRSWALEVVSAGSGEEAIDLLKQAPRQGRPFEIVLLDWKMPGMDGLEVARLIQEEVKQGGLPPLPIIIMATAYSREEMMDAAGRMHLDAIMSKPVTPSSLFDTIIRTQNQSAPLLQPAVVSMTNILTEKAASIRGARLLLVEDSEINQQVARELLEKVGLVVETASNGQEAVERVGQSDYDGVLMDLQMPGMDGFEATRQIRSVERGKMLPIIALTAAAMREDKQACFGMRV